MGNSGSNVNSSSNTNQPSYRYTRIHGDSSAWSPLAHQANPNISSNNNNSNSNRNCAPSSVSSSIIGSSSLGTTTATVTSATSSRLANDGGGNIVVKKRRNLASFATLRKKLGCKARRTSKSFDHSQIIKNFISTWSTRDIAQLIHEYGITNLLKDLHILAELARPSASTVAQDLTDLFDCNYVADAYLLFKGHTFPVHKAIVCVRCPLFRELLGKINDFGAQIPVNLDVPGLRPDFFMDLLRYLYSGEFYPSYSSANSLPSSTYDSILMKLSDQAPNSLEHDLKHLLETGLYSDAILVFTSSSVQPILPSSNEINSILSPGTSTSNSMLTGHNSINNLHGYVNVGSVKKCKNCSDQSEFSCHCAILASRSTFFRNVISRHQKRFTDALTEAGATSINLANSKIRIVIDETIIPRRFARILLHCIYRDSTDLSNLLPGCVCQCTHFNDLGQSSRLSSSSSSSSSPSYIKEIMELYEIGRFLELDSLIQACEDMLVDSLSIDNLITILKWSEQPHGSIWVKRQSLYFLREEFSLIVSSSILYQLDLNHLKDAISSDYLQASELEVLQAVIKWGEDKLFKRMEEREPNVISQTAHSLRHGLRRKELNDDELRDIISELMPYVRIGHILPSDSETLTNSIKRGLISTLPPYMLEEDSITPHPRGVSCWIRERSQGSFVKPRYFTPYVEEARSYLETRLARTNESNSINMRVPLPKASSSSLSSSSSISTPLPAPPDALYMTTTTTTTSTDSGMDIVPIDSNQNSYATYDNPSNCQEIYSHLNQLPVIEERILLLMKQRVEELERYLSSSRNLSIIPNKNQVINYIQLRVVREFGLPDGAVEVLDTSNSASYVSYSMSEASASSSSSKMGSSIYSELNKHSLPSTQPIHPSSLYGSTSGILGSDKDVYGYTQDLTYDTASDYYAPLSESYLSNYSLNSENLVAPVHQLSDVTPDIAMTTNAFADLHLMRKSTESLTCQPNIPPRRRTRSGRDWRSDVKS
ncbi:BTB/POZ domain-containing protein 7-like isoform X2 [Panonychus citri]|uniref:BTB/POZ domain-containing protein 7-like isoform X2 n=1 Tax=Panonychus citri TaxID=50023 RepID=UPI002306FA32|nr:BTB/POZ domain-containing protein 7-like isoform X2 [Panonychus citri]